MIKYILPDKTEIFEHEQFNIDDINYPAYWLTNQSEKDLKKLNISKIVIIPDIQPQELNQSVIEEKKQNNVLTNFQFKAALIQYNLFKEFNELFQSMDHDSIIFMKWQNSDIEINSSIIDLLKTNFSTTEETINKIFNDYSTFKE